MLLRCLGLSLAVVVLADGFVGAELPPADLILHGGKVVTVDDDFSLAEAVAVKDGWILAVGSDEEVLKHRGEGTEVVDLDGKMVLPGLIDSHTHPTGASMFEFDHPVPEMESIADVLDYVRSRAEAVEDAEWIWIQQVFITRLREQRYPTREELDEAAPNNPVAFRTGPDAALNSMALELSGIDKDFQVVGSGHIERDPETGEPTGILRGCTRYIKGGPPRSKATEQDRLERLETLFADYNASGLTSIADRNAGDSAIRQYQTLRQEGRLTVRVAASHSLSVGDGKLENVLENIRKIAAHPLHKNGDAMLRIVGVKTFLDGGMLTGSAYMREPWGLSKIYSITDPRYQGVLFIPKERLVPVVQAVVEEDLQFTAHSVGDGAVHTLLEAYDEVNRQTPIAATRPCITHSNFMSEEAIDEMVRLGVGADIQPAWLYLDARTLQAQFGYDRLRWFQPLATIFKKGAIAGGGSDHMQKIGSLRSINPYNPFLGMWVTITREARWYEGRLHTEEALTREQAIRFYTTNNAWLLFLEDEVGSLEKGKQADMIVIDRDLLTCPVDVIKETQVLRTYLAGKLVHQQASE
ncbi:MAG: amidohydrolase [Planctomycetes bacterium]|nr:amidohydrolase [Planctomycetota bacterium]